MSVRRYVCPNRPTSRTSLATVANAEVQRQTDEWMNRSPQPRALRLLPPAEAQAARRRLQRRLPVPVDPSTGGYTRTRAGTPRRRRTRSRTTRTSKKAGVFSSFATRSFATSRIRPRTRRPSRHRSKRRAASRRLRLRASISSPRRCLPTRRRRKRRRPRRLRRSSRLRRPRRRPARPNPRRSCRRFSAG